MSTLIKIQDKSQVTIPNRLGSKGGLAKGDLVEGALERGKIILTPKIVVDRSRFPTADADYTPTDRRAIDRGIAQSEREYREGRSAGPFDTHEEFIAALHAEAKKSGLISPRTSSGIMTRLPPRFSAHSINSPHLCHRLKSQFQYARGAKIISWNYAGQPHD